MDLINRIDKILEKLDVPKMVTSVKQPDINIENDLKGLSIFQLQNETVQLLAYDIPLFNDEAYRYYIFEFIKKVVLKENTFQDDAFIQDLFESKLLNKNTTRYKQFSKEEIQLIHDYLQKCKDEALELNEDSAYCEWIDEIDSALKFWT